MKQNASATFLKLGGQTAIEERRSALTLDALLDALADKVAQRIQPQPQGRKMLVTLKEAGEMIGRSAGAVNQLVKRGELRAIVCGRRVHLQTKEIEEWIERCKR